MNQLGFFDLSNHLKRFEPLRDCRRLFYLSHAAMLGCCSMA
jgi:hypothetical protein